MVEVLMRNEPDYIELRNNLIEQFESEVLWIYTDHRGYPTIGWGFNIQGDGDLRGAVYDQLNIPTEEFDLGLRGALDSAIAAYSTPNQTAETNPLKTQLDAILASYAPALLEAGFTIQTTFDLTEAQVAVVFNSGTGSREDALDLWLEGMDVSVCQRAALFSLTWNNYIRANGTGSPSLKAAMVRGDRAEAWYEIRYNMPDRNQGRHFAEAQVFGLYSDPLNVSDAEAQQVLDMYLLHKNDILSKNYDVRGTYTNANAYLNNANVISEITGFEAVDTLGQIFKPISNYIYERYVAEADRPAFEANVGNIDFNIQITGDVVLGHETTGIEAAGVSGTFIQPVYRWLNSKSPKEGEPLPEGITGINDMLVVSDNTKGFSLQGLYGNDVLIGGEQADNLYGGYKREGGGVESGDDVLIGGAGDDNLYGQDGMDILRGGDGVDNYYFERGDGSDTILDQDGKGQIYVKNTASQTEFNVLGSASGGVLTHASPGPFVGSYWEMDTEGHFLTHNRYVPYYDEATDGYLLKVVIDEVMLGDTTEPTNVLWIKNWKNGEFGLTITNLPPLENLPSPYVERLVEAPLIALPPRAGRIFDPLVFDLNNNGIIETTPLLNGVQFDLDNSGFAEKTNWVAPTDGLLVLDRNNNNFIDGGAELFGTETYLNNGNKAANGFEALTEFDSNHDGVINNSDTVFTELKIWKDENTNGLADAGELLTLGDAGIKSISLTNTASSFIDKNRVEHREQGSFTRTDDSTSIIHTLWFNRDARQSVAVHDLQSSPIIIPASILALPNAQGSGNTYSLREAMVLDISGALKAAVEDFVQETDSVARKELVNSILVLWAHQQNTAINSRGEFINAQHLGVLESFWGEAASQLQPSGQYAASAELIYQQLILSIYSQLMQQTHAKSLLDTVDFTYDLGKWHGDFSQASATLIANFSNGVPTALAQLQDFLAVVQGYSPYDVNTLYQDFSAAIQLAATVLPEATRALVLAAVFIGNDEVAGTLVADVLHGYQGNDDIRGLDGNDQLRGGEGHDQLDAGSGDDSLDGGAGYDVLDGGAGNDTYYFARGYNDDVINESSGVDLIELSGVIESQVHVTRDGSDLQLILDTGETLTVEGMFNEGEILTDYAIDTIRFANNVEWDLARIKKEVVIGSGNNDVLEGFDTNDVIVGHTGDDVLLGHGGDDTYQYQSGDGVDLVEDESGVDTLALGQGFRGQDVNVDHVGNNLVFTFATGGSVTVANAFADSTNGFLENTIESVSFQDGTLWDLTKIFTETLKIKGTWTSDTLQGTAGSNIFVGRGGNDLIVGGAGDDRYEYNLGDGDDVIDDESGIDIVDLGQGITADMIDVNRSGSDLVIAVMNSGIITVKNAFSNNENILSPSAIEFIRFSDSTAWGVERIQSEVQAGNTIEGTTGPDLLQGSAANDVLVGNAGNDSLRGGMGNDIYIFRPYDGNDTIFEMGGANVIQFEPYVERDENNEITLIREIKPEDIKLRKMYGTALVLETTQGVSVTLWNMFNSSTGALNANDSISSIRFSNSEAWDYARMQQEMLRFTEYNDRIEGFDFATGLSGGEGYDTLIGYGGDDTLEGGRGNDELNGGRGNDTYVFNVGDGFDSIYETEGVDTIQLGEGIGLGDVKISSVSGSSSSQNVVILLPNNHYITVWGMFNAAENNVNTAYAIDFIRFHNGDSLNSAQMLQLLLNPQKNRIEGGAGDNLLVGQLDHDYLVGNKGNDTLQGGAGDDDYYFSVGDGLDVIVEQSGVDRILLGEGYSPETVRIFRSDHRLVIKSLISADEISVNNYFMESGAVNSQSIEKIVFANGLEWGSLLIKQNLYTQATQGDDVIYGVDTNELFNGLAGNDYINSGGGNDTLNGGDGNDTLIAGVGTSILVGGTGNDVMSAGSATYKFSLGDGIDVIKPGSTRKIEFDTSVLPVAVTLQQSGKHLLLKYSESDSILIENMFGDYRYKDSTIEIKFSGGVTWSWDTVKNKIIYGADEADNIIYGVSSLHERIDGADGNDTIYGGFGRDTLLGGDGDDVIYGGDSVGGKYIYYGADLGDELLGGGGNDRLYGEAGNDLLDGGSGQDSLYGGAGNDTYVGGDGNDNLTDDSATSNDNYLFSHGYGRDSISDSGGSDSLVFDETISSSNLSIRNTYSGLLFSTGSGSSIVDKNYAIDSVLFFNNESWASDKIYVEALKPGSDNREEIGGFNSDDIITGNKGDDLLHGGAGNDTYMFSSGDGDDSIRELQGDGLDTVSLAEGLVSSDIVVIRRGENVVLALNSGDSIYVWNQFINSTDEAQFNSIERLVFSDGEEWDAARLVAESKKNNAVALTFQGEAFAEHIIGTYLGDSLAGNGGDDWIHGGVGNDMITGGDGIDTLIGGLDNDTLMGGAGNDYLLAGAGNDRLDGGEGDDVYYYDLGDGEDTLVLGSGRDRIIFGPGIGVEDVTFRRNALLIGGDKITLEGLNPEVLIEFSDGTILDWNSIYSLSLLGTSGKDSIQGYASDDVIDAGDDNDIVWGMEGNDTLISGAGLDTLYGNDGNDILISSPNLGNPLFTNGLDGGRDDDTYLIQLGSGETVITEGMQGNGITALGRGNAAGGVDLIQLPAGITEQDVSVRVSRANYGSDLTRTLEIVLSSGDVITVRGMFEESLGQSYQSFSGQLDSIGVIETIRFDNNIEWDINRILQEAVKGSAAADHISGFDTAELIAGLEGNDTIYSGGGNDTIVGGVGDDFLMDRQGDEVYRFARGDGKDTIQDSYGNDSIYFEGDITLADISAKRSDLSWAEPNNQMGESLIISLNTGESIEIMGVFSAGLNVVNDNAVIENVYFENGSSITFSALLNSISGFEVDTTPPDIPTAVFDAFGTTITGASEVSSIVTVKDADGNVLGSATADIVNGTYSVTLATALISNEIVNVTATDAAGNVSAVKAIIAPDKTAPATPTANLDTAAKVVNGVAEAGSSVTVQDSTGQTLGVVQADATTGAYSVSFTQTLINGQSIFTTATDTAGNISAATATPIVINTDPQPAGNGLRGSYYGYHQSANGNIDLSNVAQIRTIIASKAPDASFIAKDFQYGVVGAKELGMGTTLQTFLKTDAASLTVDPANTSDAILKFDGKIQLDAGAYNFRVRADDGYSILVNGVVVAEYNGNQGATTRTHATFTIAQSGLHDIEIVYWDAGGGAFLNVELANTATGIYNYLDESILFNGVVTSSDTTSPLTPDAVFDLAGKVIIGTAENGSLVEIKTSSGDLLGNATADIVNGTYSVTLATALINNEIVNVTATDAAGNISAINAIIAPDKTAPAAPTANLDTAAKIVNGIAEVGSSVTVQDSTGQTLGVVQANATTGAYSVSFTQTLINGQSIFTTATDTAGNISAATATPIVINTDPQPAGNGLRGSYYGYHQSANGNIDLSNVAQVRTIIASKAPDAAFIAKDFQYGVVGAKELGMGTTLQTFLKTDASSLNVDPANTSDAILKFDGKIQLDAGAYNFRVRADDGYSILVNGAVVAEYNGNQGATTRTHATFTIAQSGLHDIEIVYWDAGGGAFLNVELADTATGAYSYINQDILFQPMPIEPVAIVSTAQMLEADYERVHYFNRNDALIQAMATFVSESGVDTRYRAAHFDQSALMLAVGS